MDERGEDFGPRACEASAGIEIEAETGHQPDRQDIHIVLTVTSCVKNVGGDLINTPARII
jgi:hypothetical protein